MTFLNLLKDQVTAPARFTESERVALKNVVNLARERLWLAESYPGPPSPSLDFDAQLTEDDVNNSKQSLLVLENLLNSFVDEGH